MWCLQDYQNNMIKFYSTEDLCKEAVEFYDLKHTSEDYNYYELVEKCLDDDALERLTLVKSIRELRAKGVEIPLFYIAPVDMRAGIRSDVGDIDESFPFPTIELTKKFIAKICSESYDSYDIYKSYDDEHFEII